MSRRKDDMKDDTRIDKVVGLTPDARGRLTRPSTSPTGGPSGSPGFFEASGTSPPEARAEHAIRQVQALVRAMAGNDELDHPTFYSPRRGYFRSRYEDATDRADWAVYAWAKEVHGVSLGDPERDGRPRPTPLSLDRPFDHVDDEDSPASLYDVVANPDSPDPDAFEVDLAEENEENRRDQHLVTHARLNVAWYEGRLNGRDLRWYVEHLGVLDGPEVMRDRAVKCAHPGCDTVVGVTQRLKRSLDDLPGESGRPPTYCGIHVVQNAKTLATERQRRRRAKLLSEPKTGDVTPNLPVFPVVGRNIHIHQKGIQVTTTIPERVETVEDRLMRLEELFRETMQSIAQTAQKIADKVPEDKRVQGAVDDLLRDVLERGA